MAFDVKKHLITVQGGREYLPVAYRLVWFREEHPDWGVETEALVMDPERGVFVFRARVHDADGRLVASGSKMETVRGFPDACEKAETGAIGRALGVLGYGTQFCPGFDDGAAGADGPDRDEADGETPRRRRASGAGQAACEACGRSLTKGQREVSERRFGRPLCPQHQAGEPAAK
jgi:hypothetical protein